MATRASQYGITANTPHNLGPLPQVRSGIDFMAFAKGAESARDLNWRDEMRARERQRMFDQDKVDDDLRTANAYTSTFMHHLQGAAQAGIPNDQAIVRFRDQILADPTYQGMSNAAQQKVQSTLMNSVSLLADRMAKQGHMPQTMDLLSAFGMSSPFTSVDVNAAHGTPESFVAAYRKANPTSGMVFDKDTNTITPYPGAQPMPAAQAMAVLARYKSSGSLYNTAATNDLAAAEQKKIDDRLEAIRAAIAQGQQSQQAAAYPNPTPAIQAPGGGPPEIAAGAVPVLDGAAPTAQPVNQIIADVWGTQAAPAAPTAQAGPAIPAAPSAAGIPPAQPVAAQSPVEQLAADIQAAYKAAQDAEAESQNHSAELAKLNAMYDAAKSNGVVDEWSRAVRDHHRRGAGVIKRKRVAAEALEASRRAYIAGTMFGTGGK